jgi:hypothetical protein
MDIDHIFIFVDSKEATDELVDFGLNEGSGNVHKGIGTANRRFFFKNFYLEILWVRNKQEAKSLKKLGIWERYDFKNTDYSRFGFCFTNTKATDYIFKNSISWQPEFLQNNEKVDILTNHKMPWIFRFPAKRKKTLLDEPKKHKIKLTKLTKAIIKLNANDYEEELQELQSNTILQYEHKDKNSLTLEFNNRKENRSKVFTSLDLVIKY